MVEWFMRGTEPTHPCTWHGRGEVHLPPEYAEWAAQYGAPNVERTMPAANGAPHEDLAMRVGFHIASPREGDVYQVPPGVDARYATIRLEAAGDQAVSWVVDGRVVRSERWVPVPGRHTIRALSALGDTAQVHIEVR
jgi:membrane carboxypeptidase/penicillin-binding protein PbpC